MNSLTSFENEKANNRQEQNRWKRSSDLKLSVKISLAFGVKNSNIQLNSKLQLNVTLMSNKNKLKSSFTAVKMNDPT
jgi:uncharacterized protein YueI